MCLLQGYLTLRIIVHESDMFGKEIINDFNTTIENEMIHAHSVARRRTFTGPQNSELHYTIRVYCADNYYGPNCICHETVGAQCNTTTGERTCRDNYFREDCSVYCKANNDSLGHYTCDSATGKKICMEGWEGANCEISWAKPIPSAQKNWLVQSVGGKVVLAVIVLVVLVIMAFGFLVFRSRYAI